MLIGFILGVCLMSLIVTISLFTGFLDNNEVGGALTCGPAAIVILAVCWVVGNVYKSVALHYVHTKLAAYRLYTKGPGEKYYLSDTYYIEKSLDDLLYKKEDNANAYFEKFKDCTDAKSLPFWSYVIGKNGFKKKNGAHVETVLSAIRPYSELYRKIAYGA